MLNSSLRKNAETHLHTAGALQKYNQTLDLCSRAAFEEVMPRRQKNTWAFQDPDSSPCSQCCDHRRTRRGVGEGGRPPVLKNFRANAVFRARVSCSKILNDEKIYIQCS